jgi:hypothetical protein
MSAIPAPSDSGAIWRTAGSATACGAWSRAAAGAVRAGPGGDVTALSSPSPGSSVSSASSAAGEDFGAEDRVREGSAEAAAERDADREAEPEGVAEGDLDAEAYGVRPGLSAALGLTLPAGGTFRPGRGRPWPACRPASDAEALGFFAVGAGRGGAGSSA